MPEPLPVNRHVAQGYQQAQGSLPPVPHAQPLLLQPQLQGSHPAFLPQHQNAEVGGFSAGSGVLGCLGIILAFLMILGACSGVSFLIGKFIEPLFAPQVQVTTAGFIPNSVTTGDGGGLITFVNPSSGIPQLLCLGQHGRCDTRATDPGELTGHALRIDPGQSVAVSFAYVDGSSSSLDTTYHVTSITLPQLTVTVYVPPPDYSGGAGP